ncbi:Inactive serine protease PAMR1 [Collichthys lucidus]|uniref:Inactive serine protease PAMR1 n=1 Tax=Collichthys lucidus TaxID=240159 RepID=A0A4U5UF29_COLLU|nr:Inactive serine protease PAMR1 [Collichthys lucidus]
MLSAGRGLQLGQTHGGTHTIPWTSNFISGKEGWFLFVSLFILISLPQGTAWPYEYRHLYNHCPGPEWNIMCRGCCEYDVIRCKCPLQGTPVGYAVPCCRNAINECDPCIIHPGCSIFENCKRCNNGTWGPRDDFFINGKYCAECRPGWSGGDCMKCGGVIHKRQGHLVLESYPNNARCEWTIQVDRPFTIDLRFMMLSLEFHQSCRYDYVEVRDGDSISSRVIGRFCGNNRPAPVQSSGNSLHILFVSDGYKNFDGFFATFQESSGSSYTYHCACLAGYTGKRCENVVGCHRPPVPSHGSTEGLFQHSGARITFRCDPGFELRGFRSAICLRDGTWSAPAPECVPVERVCTLPPKPTHGDHFLVYGPNDVLIALQYLCYQPYELSGNSQRTCLPNNTWSGTPPVCTRVNNTLTEAEKPKETDTDIYTDKDISKTEEKSQETTAGEKESVGGEDINIGHKNTTAVDREDKYTGTTPEKTAAEGRNEGEPEERNTGSEKPTGGNKDEVDSNGPDNSLNTVEKNEPGVGKLPDKKESIPDTNVEIEKTDVTEIVVINNKGQEGEERKEKQVNGKRDPDKVGPNDTKLGTVVVEGENTVEIFEPEIVENDTVIHDTKYTMKENNSIGSPELERKTISTRVNRTQYTMYRAGGEESGKPKEKQEKTHGEDKTEKEPVEKTKEELEREREEKEKKRRKKKTKASLRKAAHLYLASTMATTSRCLGWSWKRWSSSVTTRMVSVVIPGVHASQMVPGVENSPSVSECVGSIQPLTQRGRQRLTGLGWWPSTAAPPTGAETKVTKIDSQAGFVKGDHGAGTGNHNWASDWQLVCSGALVNQRSLVVAAHCVTELGKVYPLDAAKIKVVVGKHYRDDHRDTKGLQHLRVASIAIHPNYDPHILDSDIAVVKLLDKARIGEKVVPLCLSDSLGEDVTSGQGLVTGWSPMPDSSLGPDEKARVGFVHLADVVPCEHQYARNGVPVSVTDNMLCASQKPDYVPSNICPSDTGGILVLPALSENQATNNQRSSPGFTEVKGENTGLWRLLGLVSFGYDQGECDPDLYTVYTHVANFKDWLESNMK